MFFLFWLTLLCVIISRSIHVTWKWPNFVPFHDWIRFHCIYVPHLLYPFFCWQTSMSLLLYIVLQWTLRFMCLFEIRFSLSICPEVGLYYWEKWQECLGWRQCSVSWLDVDSKGTYICKTCQRVHLRSAFYFMSLHFNKNIEMHMLIIHTTIMNIFLVY